ncbi:MAG: ThiF family adenylyltransferase [Candidatus Bipolaricaulota bacterium]
MAKEEKRYDRQNILSQWNEGTQENLENSRIVIVGCGALGTNTSATLARAGVGELTLVDRDFVELSNLHRTALYNEEDVGRAKANVIHERIEEINSTVSTEALPTDLDPLNAERVLGGHDLILDCTDNLLTRYLINDFAVKFEVPWIYAAVIETTGMTMNISPGEGPCFRCLFPERPPSGTLPTCDTAGVINTIPKVISALQSTEAIKCLDGREVNTDTLLNFDVWARDLSTINIERNDECICCGEGEYQFLESEVGQTSHSVCGREAIQINPHREDEIDLKGLAKKLRGLGEVEARDVLLRFEVEDYRINVFRDGRAIIEGTEEEKVARSLYSKYIGN